MASIDPSPSLDISNTNLYVYIYIYIYVHNLPVDERRRSLVTRRLAHVPVCVARRDRGWRAERTLL